MSRQSIMEKAAFLRKQAMGMQPPNMARTQTAPQAAGGQVAPAQMGGTPGGPAPWAQPVNAQAEMQGGPQPPAQMGGIGMGKQSVAIGLHIGPLELQKLAMLKFAKPWWSRLLGGGGAPKAPVKKQFTSSMFPQGFNNQAQKSLNQLGAPKPRGTRLGNAIAHPVTRTAAKVAPAAVGGKLLYDAASAGKQKVQEADPFTGTGNTLNDAASKPPALKPAATTINRQPTGG